MDLLRIIIAILLPPLGVLLQLSIGLPSPTPSAPPQARRLSSPSPTATPETGPNVQPRTGTTPTLWRTSWTARRSPGIPS
jgi:hypothetical protein